MHGGAYRRPRNRCAPPKKTGTLLAPSSVAPRLKSTDAASRRRKRLLHAASTPTNRSSTLLILTPSVVSPHQSRRTSTRTCRPCRTRARSLPHSARSAHRFPSSLPTLENVSSRSSPIWSARRKSSPALRASTPNPCSLPSRTIRSARHNCWSPLARRWRRPAHISTPTPPAQPPRWIPPNAH